MIKDYFKIAIANLTHRKVRTFLTLIGIFIGIAAVVGLISLSTGFQDYLDSEFKALGADKIIVNPSGAAFGVSDNSANPLTKSDVEIIADVRGVKQAAYINSKVSQIEWGKDDFGFNMVWAYKLDETRDLIEEIATLTVEEGRPLKEIDRGKAVIGYDYAKFAGFEKNLVPGNKIFINEKEFKVVGIFERIGNPTDDRSIVIHEDDFEELFNTGDDVGGIYVRVDEGELPSEVVTRIEDDLRDFRDLKEGEEDFEVTTFEDLIQSFLTILNIAQVVLVGIAAISLVVGGIGIMNTMYTAVLERTKDIGIMKAIGARNEDILILFLIESGFLGLVGGIIGVLLGFGLSKGVEFVGGTVLGTELLQAAMPIWLIIGALLFAFLLGSIFGVLPAIRASKMSPVDALRTE